MRDGNESNIISVDSIYHKLINIYHKFMKIETRLLETTIAARSLTYKEFATAAGITERTLQNARNGHEIQPATVGKIAGALGVPVDKFIK